MAEEISWVDVAVFPEEFTITAAAEHHIWVQFAAKLSGRFGDDAGEIGNTIKFFAE